MNALLSGRMWGLRFQRGDKEISIVRSIDGKMVEERKKVSFKIHCFLSIKQTIKKTVKHLYVIVGISDFKFPLCTYGHLRTWRGAGGGGEGGRGR